MGAQCVPGGRNLIPLLGNDDDRSIVCILTLLSSCLLPGCCCDQSPFHWALKWCRHDSFMDMACHKVTCPARLTLSHNLSVSYKSTLTQFSQKTMCKFALCVSQARSLLTAHEDFTTLMFTSPTEIQRPGLVFTFLKKYMPSEATVEEVKRMSLTADGKSAVFDVPSKLAQVRCAAL